MDKLRNSACGASLCLALAALILLTSFGCGSGGDSSQVVTEAANRKKELDVVPKVQKKP